jgi:hypothetical protein
MEKTLFQKTIEAFPHIKEDVLQDMLCQQRRFFEGEEFIFYVDVMKLLEIVGLVCGVENYYKDCIRLKFKTNIMLGETLGENSYYISKDTKMVLGNQEFAINDDHYLDSVDYMLEQGVPALEEKIELMNIKYRDFVDKVKEIHPYLFEFIVENFKEN